MGAAGAAGRLGYDLGHALGVAVHGAVAYHDALFGLVAAQAVVDADDLLHMLVPHRSVGGAEIVELHAGQLLERILHGRAVFAHDVAVVTHHLEPEGVAVDVGVDDAAVEGAEAAERVAREEHVAGGVECHHRLGPVHHGGKHKLQGVGTQLERVVVLHLHQIVGDAVEALGHAECLLVAHNLDFGIVFAYQGDGPAVVGLHVVHHEIVDGAVAYHLVYILKILDKEVHLHGVDEADFLVDDEIGVVRHSVGQRPQALEEFLVAVVDAYIVDLVGYFRHDVYVSDLMFTSRRPTPVPRPVSLAPPLGFATVPLYWHA